MQEEALLELAHGAALLIAAHPVHLPRFRLGFLHCRAKPLRAQRLAQQQVADAGADIRADPEILEGVHHQQDLDIPVIAPDLVDERDAVQPASGHAQDDDLRADLTVQAIGIFVVLGKSDDVAVQFFPRQHIFDSQLPVHALIDDDDLEQFR